MWLRADSNLAFGKQHRGQQMAEHGIAGRAAQPLFAELARLVRLPGIERGGGAANDVLGGGCGSCRADYRRVVIPGRAKHELDAQSSSESDRAASEFGIEHCHGAYGFRARAKRRVPE